MNRKNKLFLIFFILTGFLIIFLLFSVFFKIQATKQAERFKTYRILSSYNIPLKVLDQVLKASIEEKDKDKDVNFVNIISLLATKFYGDFKNFKEDDVLKVVLELKNCGGEKNLEKLYENYIYFKRFYGAIFSEFVGTYEIAKQRNKKGEPIYCEKFGLKAYSPIAYGFESSYCDDFDCDENFGKKRIHLGNDIAAKEGTPFVAVESGIISKCEKNKNGAFEVNLKSFDGKRIYCYSNCRNSHPVTDRIKVGAVVYAGQPLGYVGGEILCGKGGSRLLRFPCLHFSVKLNLKRLDEEKFEEIPIDYFTILKFLEHHKSAVVSDGKDCKAKYIFKDPTYWKNIRAN